MKKAGKAFYRSLLSFLALLLVPVMLVWYFSMSYLRDSFRQQYTESTFRSMRSASQNLDEMVRQMYNVGFLLQSRSDILQIRGDSRVCD
ncbi:MAG: hypothetical protein IJ246_00505 [Clostridia bacterium]|nr:hypothetical protein [Clostridia bacterium]